MSPDKIEINFPDSTPENSGEDSEYCFVDIEGKRKKVKLNDFSQIYSVPGLYETLYYDHCRCVSPTIICALLEDQLSDWELEPSSLKVLNFRAGNGVIGEGLSRIGVDYIVGVDPLKEAALATKRDRPAVYSDYVTGDLSKSDSDLIKQLEQEEFNCLTTARALDSEDISNTVFTNAFNLIESPGWVAFHVNEDYLETENESPLSRLLYEMIENDIFDLRVRHKYQHRFDWKGDPVYFEAIIGIKQNEIPEALINEFSPK